eukprot:1304463-Rhodomonas_salina.1
MRYAAIYGRIMAAEEPLFMATVSIYGCNSTSIDGRRSTAVYGCRLCLLRIWLQDKSLFAQTMAAQVTYKGQTVRRRCFVLKSARGTRKLKGAEERLEEAVRRAEEADKKAVEALQSATDAKTEAGQAKSKAFQSP